MKRRQRTIRNAVSHTTSLLHTGSRVSFAALAGVPPDGEVTHILLKGSSVTVKWVEP